MEEGNLFNIGEFVDVSFRGVDCSKLALKAKTDMPAKEELYGRLANAMGRLRSHYSKRYPFLDESDIDYGLFLTTERTIAGFSPAKGNFVYYWSSCAKRFMMSYVAKAYSHVDNVNRNEIEFHDFLCPSTESDGRPSIDPSQALASVTENCDGQEKSIYVLYLAGYTAEETAKMLDCELVPVRSAIKKINREIKLLNKERAIEDNLSSLRD